MKTGEMLPALLDKALRERHGENAPEEIRVRAGEEMERIKASGWEDDFLRAYQITRRLSQAGVPWLLCGADGGNSFVAYLLGITQVDPLPPHYDCPKCKRIEFVSEVRDGFDLPEKVCETCGAAMQGDGHGLDFSQFPQTCSLFGTYRLPTCGVPLVHEVLSSCPAVTPFSRKWLDSEDYKLDGWFLAPPEQFENAVWVDGYIPPERKEKVKAVLRDENDRWFQLPKIELVTGGYVERLHWLCEKAGIKEEAISPHDPAALKSLFAALGDDCLADTNLAATTGLYNLKGPFGKEKEELLKRELRLKAAKEAPCFSNLVRFRGEGHITAHSVSFGAVYVRLAWFNLHYPNEYKEALEVF